MRELFHEKKRGEVKRYSKGRAAAIISVISVLTCLLTIFGFLWMRVRFGDVNLVRAWVLEHPLLGAAVMVAVTALQVVIALIPGELVEVAAGYAFGAWGGAALCLLGMAMGSTVAILLTRRFGRALVEALYPKEKLDALPILNEPKQRNALTAILFLIPGTPKDLLTYVIGLTEMSIPRYLTITRLCRFPSVIMSTVSGAALGDDRLRLALYCLIITGLISAGGYLLYQALQKRKNS